MTRNVLHNKKVMARVSLQALPHQPPSLFLLGFDDIAKYMVADIQDLLAMGTSVLAESIRRA